MPSARSWMSANASRPLQSSSPAFPGKPLQTSPARSAKRSPLLLRRLTSSPTRPWSRVVDWSRLPPRGADLAIDEVMESSTNEASRYKLRLRPGGCPVGIALALSWLWQDLNHEGVDPRHSL